MTRKSPSQPKGQARTLSDADIVSKPSAGRTSTVRGTRTDADSDAGEAAKAPDRDAASDSDKRAPGTPARASTDKDKNRD